VSWLDLVTELDPLGRFPYYVYVILGGVDQDGMSAVPSSIMDHR
jgi:hypothetical protein